jgi:putative DNA primase/helicase
LSNTNTGDDVQGQGNTKPPTNEEILAAARAYEARGWVPTPLHTVGPDGTTCSCPKGARCGKSAGKHNVFNDWAKDFRGTEAFEELHAKRRRTNIGILTGKPSGFFVLDIDIDREGGDDMRRMIAKHGKMPPTLIIKTGSGGFHYYFNMPADFDVTNREKGLRKAGYKGLDIRGTGGQVVAPPSMSWAGPYVIQKDAPIADAPEWLLALLRPAANTDPLPTEGIEAHVAVVEAHVAANNDAFFDGPANNITAPTGEQTAQQAAYEKAIVNGETKRLIDLKAAGWDMPWDTTTFEVACQMVELANADWSSLSLDEAHMLFLDSCPPEEPGYEPQAKWDSALQRVGDKKRPAPQPRKDVLFEERAADTADPRGAAGADRKEAPTASSPAFGLSDLGNADRLIHWHGDKIRYAADAQTWLTYSAGVWADEIAEVEVEELAKHALARAEIHERDSHSDVPDDYTKAGDPKPTARARFFEWMGKSQMYPKIVAMRSMARSDARVRTALGEFDRDPMMFNASNCAVNLETGEVVPHSPEQMFRHQSSIAYNPDAKCPMWDRFLARVQPDPEMREYLQQTLGYSMTGRMDEHAIFIHNGPGATGKTTFLEVIGAVMGNYGQKLDRETLLSKAGTTAIPADVARMAGARFLAASETAAGRKLDDERIKELVGGDTQTARHLYGKWFDFKPTGKIHMATNHLPSFESGGDGMGRRLRLVPWEQQIPEGERDKTLKERIVASEAEGVLAWLVSGAVAWSKKGGLVTPHEVVVRSKEHVEEADPVWPFIHERLEMGDGYMTEFASIYGAYETWSQLNGNRPMSGRAFSLALRERLGADSKVLNSHTRRSCFKVKLNLMAVPAQHDEFFTGTR